MVTKKGGIKAIVDIVTMTTLSKFAIMSVLELDLGGIRIIFGQIYQTYMYTLGPNFLNLFTECLYLPRFFIYRHIKMTIFLLDL